jgi:hypothetical protein
VGATASFIGAVRAAVRLHQAGWQPLVRPLVIESAPNAPRGDIADVLWKAVRDAPTFYSAPPSRTFARRGAERRAGRGEIQ